jgi:ATP:corrinoid adenosyltransferase
VRLASTGRVAMEEVMERADMVVEVEAVNDQPPELEDAPV